MSDLEMVSRIKREIQYLKVLRHPHIIKLYEVLTTPTEIIMVMEYAGSELFNLIVENGKMTERDARRLFQQIISAVDFCHRHNIVHRDLKPENVLLDGDRNVKLADFGLSNLMTDGDFLKTSCGSPNYAAPEVISGKLYAGPEVDVWSCGVILFVMLCGRLPFDEDYIPALFKKINEGLFTIPSHVSAEARDLISSMLIVDPICRATIADIQRNPWFAVDLPSYLRPLPSLDNSQMSIDNVDLAVVDELCRRLNLTNADIMDAIKYCSVAGNKDKPEFQSIQVAYQLLLDQKRHVIDQIPISMRQNSLPPHIQTTFSGMDIDSVSILSSSLSARGSLASGNPLLSARPADLSIPKSESVENLPMTHPSGDLPFPLQPQLVNVNNAASSSNLKKMRARWHLGIRSNSPPKEILVEIYQSLCTLGVEWKAAVPISDASVPLGPGGALSTSSGTELLGAYRIPSRLQMSDGYTIFFEWTLFRIPQVNAVPAPLDDNSNVKRRQQPAGGGYLVDFKHEGWKSNTSKGVQQPNMPSTVLFMDLCGQLIVELAVNG
eukprot:Partr_v1_DN27636_c0_g1_i1_m65045 putative carbon catabolite derepressing protein kinase